jgi:hypothetical protein
MDIWAAQENSNPPFGNHEELYSVIDSTALGDIPWESFSVTYSGELPEGETPPWMLAEYDIWYRNPRSVLRNQMANPDFKGEIDYAAKQVFDADDEREFQDLLSGNWGWEQSVRRISFTQPRRCMSIGISYRTSLPKILLPMVRCLSLSFLAVIRLLYLSQLVTPSTIRSMPQVEMFTIMFDVLIGMQLLSLPSWLSLKVCCLLHRSKTFSELWCPKLIESIMTMTASGNSEDSFFIPRLQQSLNHFVLE